MELMQERNKISNDLNKALFFIKSRGRELAEAERDYKIENAKCLILKKTDGFPATLILDLCKGDEKVAELRFKRDSARTLYRSALEAVNIKKIELRVIEEDIKAIRKGE